MGQTRSDGNAFTLRRLSTNRIALETVPPSISPVPQDRKAKADFTQVDGAGTVAIFQLFGLSLSSWFKASLLGQGDKMGHVDLLGADKGTGL